jgi:hypothetical protein
MKSTAACFCHTYSDFWEEEQMLRLFDSLMRNYPIQTLLFWRTKDEIKARKFMSRSPGTPI